MSPVLASGDNGHVLDLPGIRTGRYPVRLVPNPRHSVTLTTNDLIGRTH